MENETPKQQFYQSNGKSLPDVYEAPHSFEGLKRSNASLSSHYEITSTVHTRSPFSRKDYDFYRPGEKTPTKFKKVVKACRCIYETNGVVRNVINLMVDFAVEDLLIIHIDPKIEAFYKAWAKKVMLNDVIEEFARHILVEGNTVIKTVTGKLTKPAERSIVKAKPDFTIKVDKNEIESREIPIRYLFYDIVKLDWNQDEFQKMIGEKSLCMKLDSKFIRQVREAAKKHPELFNKLPNDIKKHLNSDQNRNKSVVQIELDMSKIHVSHYKKDSWENWATPYLSGVIENIQFKDKLRLADLSALDGVINVIRLWKLGDHTEGIFPNPSVVERLHDVLQANTGGGAMDIVWDSMIEMEEYYPPVDKILGPEKYEQVNRDILFGLGIPEVLLGGQGANFSNSWIQLKTIIEKLEYIRSKILDWLDTEVKNVAKAMNFNSPATVKFKKMNLQDENITKKLILGLLDRGIISPESVLNEYDEDFSIQVEKIKRQNKVLEEAGIEVKSPFDMDDDEEDQEGGKGRPPESVEKNNRKDRSAKPKKASGSIYSQSLGIEILDIIQNTIVRDIISSYNVSNARKLNSEQKYQLDLSIMSALSCFSKEDDINKESVYIKCTNKDNYNFDMINEYVKAINEFKSESGGPATASQLKFIKASIWAKYN